MANDIDLGKISITPNGDWTAESQVEYNDIWRYNDAKYLALQNSKGVTPADDKIYWYELSSQGKSAYREAVENGFAGTEAEWIQSLKQPAIDAATQAKAAVEFIDKRFPEKMNEIKSDLSDMVSSEVADKVVRPLSITTRELKIGSFKIGGDDVDIYERAVVLEGLPISSGQTKTFVVSDTPLGYGLYFSVESFVASTGRGLTSSFFNFSYQITGYSINDQLQSVITIECTKDVSMPVNGILNLRYCKFYGDVVELDITLPPGINKEAITLEIPPLKYNKKMVFSYITDDSYSIYQYFFSLINKRLVVKKFGPDEGSAYTWHLGMQGNPQYTPYIKDSYYPEYFAQCTDGAGIKHRYATTVSTWPEKLKDQKIGQDVGMHWPWMSEKEFKLYFDFGFTCAYHDLTGYDSNTDTQEKFDECVNKTAALFEEYVGIVPKVMVEPNGDHKYLAYSQNNESIQAVTAQSGDKLIKSVYPFRPDFTLDKKQVAVQRIFAYGDDLVSSDNPKYVRELMDALSAFNSSTDKNTIYWVIGSAHRSSHWESMLIKNIHQLYGDIGNDSLWFPTIDEMFEYWYMRENSFISKTLTDTGIHFKIYVPKAPNHWFRDLSVLISGITSTNGVNVTSGGNVYGTSYAINDGKLLVNLDFNQLLLDRVNKFVEAFEANYNAEYAYDDAYYFIQRLKPGLKEPYLARINKWISSPVLESFKINNGQDSTQSKNVTLNISFSGQGPSHYMASESPDFIGGNWIEYTENPMYKLSDGFNSKTVYLKLKNVYGETGALSDSIVLLEPTLTLNSISINDGAASTIQRNINISFDYAGYPTHYMISESLSFTGASWVEFSENPQIQLSESYGNKTLYAKLKNETTETVSRSSAIELIDTTTARLNSVVINSGDEYTDSGVVSVVLSTLNAITKYKIGKQADLSDCPKWIAWSGSTVQYDSKTTDGNLTIYAQVGNGTTESSIKSDSIQVVQHISLTSLSLANGQPTFAGRNVPVSFELVGTPTHYRLSETSVGLSSTTWLAWSDNINYNFSSIGDKTLYGQVKNIISESNIVDCSISLIASPLKMIIGFSHTVNNAIEYKTVNGEIINQVSIAVHTSYGSQQLKDNQGNPLEWFFNFNSNKYSSNSIFANDGSSSYINESSANDNGIYPVSVFLKSICSNINVKDGANKSRLSFTLPAGHYKVRVLYSPADNFLLTEQYRTNSFYGVFRGNEQLAKVVVGSAGFTGKGNNQYNNEFEFDVSKIANFSDVDFAAWQEGSLVQGYRPGINLIELTKLS